MEGVQESWWGKEMEMAVIENFVKEFDYRGEGRNGW